MFGGKFGLFQGDKDENRLSSTVIIARSVRRRKKPSDVADYPILAISDKRGAPGSFIQARPAAGRRATLKTAPIRFM
jgi:hypothetical protein